MGTSYVVFCHRVYQVNHPHAYGDKLLPKSPVRKSAGSSPRVWGQAPETSILLKFSWIIPTRMGTRHILLCVVLYRGDHPHAYGDKGL